MIGQIQYNGLISFAMVSQIQCFLELKLVGPEIFILRHLVTYCLNLSQGK